MRLSLNGSDWQFKDYYGEDWRWRDAHKPGTRDTRFWRVGSVPGSVHNDLWAAGEIPDPYFEMNSLLLEWIPDRTWLYKKTFFVDESQRGKRIRLCFEGVDYEAEFYLNGEWLGEHRGMYAPASFEVSDLLRFGQDNLIAVVIQPAPHEQPQVGRTSRVRAHKSRMTYWWDFCPRMVHVGIWDDVYLEITGEARIEDVFARPLLADDFRSAEINVSVDLDALQAQTVDVEAILRLGEDVIARERVQRALSAGKNALSAVLHVDSPHLWYPNGQGEQPLYEVDVTVYPADGIGEEALLDRRAVPCGIRKVELIQNEGAEPGALPYTFVVNGRKVYVNGWNWVPMDVMYGVPRPQKLQRLFALAQRAHVNLLRVWGGGLIEKEAFYDLADRLGMMVWQEFIQSSSGIDNNPPEDPTFIDQMAREAEQIIPRKRNHPSLVLWCGGNELQTGSEQPADDRHPMLAALKAVVRRLDPDRLWLATSPTGRVFSNSLENIQRDPAALHDVHGPWEYQGVTEQYTLYNSGSSLLHSEFGVEGITTRKTLDVTIAPDHQAPVTLDNPLWQHLGAWWVKQHVWQQALGEVSAVTMLLKGTQFMQASGLQYALEADRRREFHNSGTLPWQFNEPYPMAACTSAVDYYAQPKPVYYAVAHAYEPLHVSAKFPTIAWAGRELFEAELWVSNSYESAYADAHLEAKLVGFDGRIYKQWAQQVGFPANQSVPLVSVQFPLSELANDVFFLDLVLRDAGGKAVSSNRYAFTRAAHLAPLLAAPPTTLDVQQDASGDTWHVTITNTGANTALFVWLEDARERGAAGYVYFSDNDFCLFPQEKRTIQVAWDGVPVSERNLDAQGWNTGETQQKSSR